MDRQSVYRTGRNVIGKQEIGPDGRNEIGKQIGQERIIKMDWQSGDQEIGNQEIKPEGIRMDKMESGGGRSRRHIPEEIIADIVVELPVKSLIRFKTVSKSWFKLINSDDFKYKHFNNRMRTRTRSLQQREEEEEEEGGSYLAMCWISYDEYPYIRPFLDVYLYELRDDTFVAVPSQNDTKKSLKIPGRPPCVDLYIKSPDLINLRLVGNCNGIVCLDDYGIFMLVNPFLSELKRLPGEFLTPERLRNCVVGFGFDKTIMDFKVVRFFPSEKIGEVYSLKSNTWKKLDETCGISLIRFGYNTPCTYFNGKLYWRVVAIFMGEGRPTTGYRILTFNLATELFQLVEYPQCFPKDGGLFSGFILSNQESSSLAFVFCSKDGLVNLWTMVNNEEVTPTWTQLYSIQCSPHFLRPVCFSFSNKHNTFIYLTKQGERGPLQLVKYDIMNQSSSTISEPIRLGQSLRDISRPCYSSFKNMGVCRPSLLSLNSM